MKRKLQQLEENLLKVAFCSDIDWLNRHIHTDFIEYGSSGNRYNKKQVIKYLLSQTIDRPISLQDFSCQKLTDDSWQVYYQTQINHQLIQRTSIWVLVDDRLQIKFHQAKKISTNREK